jgi:hypothetical protein
MNSEQLLVDKLPIWFGGDQDRAERTQPSLLVFHAVHLPHAGRAESDCSYGGRPICLAELR